MTANKTIVLLHTCDARVGLWATWHKAFFKHWSWEIPCPVYFACETKYPWFDGVSAWPTGEGEWSDRLIEAVDSLPSDIETIFYLQEDFWPVADFSADHFSDLLYRFKSENLYALHVCRPTHLYKLDGDCLAPDSPYLMNHQPGFWRRDFLRSCLKENESPWENELEGTKRLHKMDMKRKIGIEMASWYIHACKKGKLTEDGKCLSTKIEKESSFQDC